MNAPTAKPHATIDLRSDSVVAPSTRMRHAVANAQIGRYHGDDPTISELEQRTAERFGKSEGLFLPSVTMGNLIAVMAITQPGHQVLVDEDSHVYRNESGGIARIAHVLPRVVPRVHGLPDVEAVATATAWKLQFEPPATLAITENTHNRAGGAVTTGEQLKSLTDVLAGHDVRVHIDGARIFYAAAALNQPESTLTATADTVAVGFAKGLGCPVGCVLVGPSPVIEKARELRALLGAPLHKAGVLAAACLLGLTDAPACLKADVALAKMLGNELIQNGICLSAPVESNIVLVETTSFGSADEVVHELAERGVLVLAVGPHRIRITLHNEITPAAIHFVCDSIARIAASRKKHAESPTQNQRNGF